jgi:hypothetical protein
MYTLFPQFKREFWFDPLLTELSVELRFPKEGLIFPVEWSLEGVVMRKEGTGLLRRWRSYREVPFRIGLYCRRHFIALAKFYSIRSVVYLRTAKFLDVAPLSVHRYDKIPIPSI